MILNCAIVDDEPLALELLRSYGKPITCTKELVIYNTHSGIIRLKTDALLYRERPIS